MNRDELVRRLMKTFLGEFGEHVQALDRDLLGLEREPAGAARVQRLKSLLRTAHSLKGAARSVNMNVIEAAAHRLEAIFAGVRDETVMLGPELFEVLFAAVDAAKEAATRLAAGADLANSPLAAVLSRLELAATNQLPQQNLRERSPGSADRAAQTTTADSITPPPDEPMEDDGWIRLPAARLDRLLAMGGELLVARRRAEGRGTDIAAALEAAQRLEVDWRTADAAVRKARRANGGGAPEAPSSGDVVTLPSRLVERAGRDLRRLLQKIDALAAALSADRKALDLVASPLEFEVQFARMVPFATACEGLERVVRDLAQRGGKDASLAVQGGEIEIDRSVAQSIKDPLMHLVRNAVDHGIEPPAVRARAGKEPRGQITLSASLSHGRVEIVVADDGRGLDVAAIREQARRQNISVPEAEDDVTKLIFTSGFSTSGTVTEISGRGVGLDVVRSAIQARRGDVSIAFEPGAGTRVTLILPTSLTRIPALLMAAGDQTYAVDTAAVRGLLRVTMDEIGSVEGRDVVTFGGDPVPLVSLSALLGLPRQEPPPTADKVPVVIIGAAKDHAALMVKELIAEQDIVVKDLGPRLRHVPNVSGATVLASGRIALILNAAELVSAALARRPERVAQPQAAHLKLKRILVADDSVTTRTLMKSILEAAGYEVIAAADGKEAWDVLQARTVDLVVSDVEMPHMDGIALTEAVRNSNRLRSIPVILVTALASEQDRLRGLEAGADAYLVKSAFDQADLMHAIGQML